MHTRNLLALLAGAVVLAACGGGDGDGVAADGTGTTGSGGTGASASNAVPDSAFGSVDAFVAYLRQLGNDETSEPLALPSGPAPTSDTTEPTA
ncbi:hypothetical protein [Ramlibacter algicola]|uniref:Uncharacterized protein n=1 Tax=Ramlibacter algicola TaxID=2795217 RepID=A0A934Q176_9BURK|nr:hypothetical protein [Ramlibacter algicola]MBK0392382.1 hypothetical protein [Ramlibacter algicola]